MKHFFGSVNPSDTGTLLAKRRQASGDTSPDKITKEDRGALQNLTSQKLFTSTGSLKAAVNIKTYVVPYVH